MDTNTLTERAFVTQNSSNVGISVLRVCVGYDKFPFDERCVTLHSHCSTARFPAFSISFAFHKRKILNKQYFVEMYVYCKTTLSSFIPLNCHYFAT
jgi:hypothetical protein